MLFPLVHHHNHSKSNRLKVCSWNGLSQPIRHFRYVHMYIFLLKLYVKREYTAPLTWVQFNSVHRIILWLKFYCYSREASSQVYMYLFTAITWFNSALWGIYSWNESIPCYGKSCRVAVCVTCWAITVVKLRSRRYILLGQFNYGLMITHRQPYM